MCKNTLQKSTQSLQSFLLSPLLLLLFFFIRLGFELRALPVNHALTKQALYGFRYTSSPFCSDYFAD
jgi:hypothetical protein